MPGAAPRSSGRGGAPAPTLRQLRVSRPGVCSPGLGALLVQELPRAPRAPLPEAASRPGRGPSRTALGWEPSELPVSSSRPLRGGESGAAGSSG